MTELIDRIPVPTTRREAGFVAPIIGRKALHDVPGFLGFPLIRAGEAITQDHLERASAMGKLFELNASTEVNR